MNPSTVISDEKNEWLQGPEEKERRYHPSFLITHYSLPITLHELPQIEQFDFKNEGGVWWNHVSGPPAPIPQVGRNDEFSF